MTKDTSTLYRYRVLKELKVRKMREGKLAETEEEIAVDLGLLLGYDKGTIMDLA